MCCRILRGEGWTSLAAQIKETIRQRYRAAVDPKAELEALTAALAKEQDRRTGATKQKWLDDLHQKISD